MLCNVSFSNICGMRSSNDAPDEGIDFHSFRRWPEHDSHCLIRRERLPFYQRSTNAQEVLHFRLVLSIASILVLRRITGKCTCGLMLLKDLKNWILGGLCDN